MDLGRDGDLLATELAELPNVYARIEPHSARRCSRSCAPILPTRENEWRGVRVGVRDLEVYAPAGYYAVW